jgi:hypothetical protein
MLMLMGLRGAVQFTMEVLLKISGPLVSEFATATGHMGLIGERRIRCIYLIRSYFFNLWFFLFFWICLFSLLKPSGYFMRHAV